MNEIMYDICICIFGCVTIEKYRKQIDLVNNTWGKWCMNNNNVKILYFLGEEQIRHYTDEQYVYLPNVDNSYLSASHKQYLGLKYIHENVKTKFVLCCGTDTYINIPKLLLYIHKFNYNENIYIGGHGCHRKIDNKEYYFHSGGPGFIITKQCLERLYPLLRNLVEDWIDICKKQNIEELIPCCDVSISYYLQKKLNTIITKTGDLSFINCNYKGLPCHMDEVKMQNIVSCHLMNEQDFHEYTVILERNNYFI